MMGTTVCAAPGSRSGALKTARDWTLKESLFLKQYAGTRPLSILARDLGRDVQDVASECARLGVPIVYVGTFLHWCDECATWRAEMRQGGRCLCCDRLHQLHAVESRIARLLELLPFSTRELYASTETHRGARKKPAKPKAPCYDVTNPRDEVRELSAYYADLDGWEAKRLYRAVKAAQKRKERITKKVIAHGLEHVSSLELCVSLAWATLDPPPTLPESYPSAREAGM